MLVPFPPLYFCFLLDGPGAPESSDIFGVTQKVGNHFRVSKILSLHCMYFLNSGTLGRGSCGFLLLISNLLIVLTKCFLDK